MRLQRPRLVTLAVAGVMLVLAARVAWHASHTDVGWEMVGHNWGRTLAGLAGVDRPALSEQEPEDQARFWLKEVERLDAENAPPNVAAGGAWVLDAPATEFLKRHYRENKTTRGFPGLPLGARVELDYAAVNRAADRFEDLCHGHRIRLIEHATQLDAANVDMWRTRALLLFRHEFLGLGFSPCQHDWRSVLDECAAHDPENALYDYLAALAEWTSAADHRWAPAGYTLEVRDPEGYERGNRRFAAGLGKPRLMFGSNGYLDTLAFLEKTSISPMDRLEIAESCAIGGWAANLLYSLLRWQGHQQSVQRRDGNFAAAATTLREALHVAGQVSSTGNPAGLITEPLVFRRFTLAFRKTLSAESPDALDADELQNLDAEYREVRLEVEIAGKVGERLKAKDHLQRGPVDTAAAGLAGFTQPFPEIILLLALCFTILVRLCGKTRNLESVRLGVLFHLAAWIAGFGLSYVVFGLCPAGIISPRVQIWVVLGLLALPFIFASIVIPIVLNRKFRIGYSQLTAVSISFALLWAIVYYWAALPDLLIDVVGSLYPWATILSAIALLVAGWFTIKLDLAFLRRTNISGRDKSWLAFLLQLLAAFTIPWGPTIAGFVETNLAPKIWIPARVWSEAQALGITADDLPSGITQRPWLFSLLQWDAYHGFYAGMVLSLLSLPVLLMFRLSRATPGGFRQLLRQRKIESLRLTAATAARSLVLAGMGALLVYLATVPAHIDEREAYYQRHYSRLADPLAARREIETEIAAIRSDATLMVELRQKAEH